MTIGKHLNNNPEALRRIEKSTHILTRDICRVVKKTEGLKEGNLMKAFHTFLISHDIYSAPFLKVKKMELNMIDALIRTGVKKILNI